MLTWGFYGLLLAGELAAIVLLIMGLTSKLRIIWQYCRNHPEDEPVQNVEQRYREVFTD